MPLKSERERVLNLLFKKLSEGKDLSGPGPKSPYLVWMSRYGDAKGLPDSQRVNDGFYKYPASSHHSFYTEFKTETIHEMMGSVGWRKSFHHIRSLGQGGRDQLFVYAKKKKGTWI